MALAMTACASAFADDVPPLVDYSVTSDAIDRPLAGELGDAKRGAALFANRQVSTCLLCHADPSAGQSAKAIGPSLVGVGARLTAEQIRLRIVDAQRVNPETIMPSFYKVDGLTRVGRQWQGRPVLTPAQIEDLVAWLSTLRNP
jgi:sulfur-oxidizing protein SoxX